MFWRKKEPPAFPFTGSAFESALEWCQYNNEVVNSINKDSFEVQLDTKVVHVERHKDDDWLYAWSLSDRSVIPVKAVGSLKAYQALTEIQIEHLDVAMDIHGEGDIIYRFNKLMRYQGNSDWMNFNLLSTFAYLLNGDSTRVLPPEAVYFYVNGKRFVEAWEAAAHYMRTVRRDRFIEETDEYISFEAGGMGCAIARTTLSHEFVIRFGFSDFTQSHVEGGQKLNAHLFAAAYRKPPYKTASYVFDDGVSELAISGVLTAGTDATPVFTRTLAEIYQVVLDSTERIKMNPGLLDGSQVLQSEEDSIRQAALYHGDLTGGSEHLEDS